MNGRQQQNRQEEMQLVYKYQVRTNINGISRNRFFKINEYFIPDLGICFNEYSVFKSEEPRYTLNSNITHKASPLTAIQLPVSLINEIKKSVGKHISAHTECPQLLTCNDYQQLFKSEPHEYKQDHSGLNKISCLEHFWSNYNYKGNNILKSAFIHYIMTNETPPNVSLDELLSLINKLNLAEIKSLHQSLEIELSSPNHQFSTLRSQELQQITTQHEPIKYSTVGGVTGVITSKLFSKHPITGFGFGLFGGYAVSYVKSEYRKYVIGQQWDEKEERKTLILEKLNQLMIVDQANEPMKDYTLTPFSS